MAIPSLTVSTAKWQVNEVLATGRKCQPCPSPGRRSKIIMEGMRQVRREKGRERGEKGEREGGSVGEG